MRLILKLTSNNELIPFNYQHFLIGIFHKWMDWNEIHDDISLYSFSWLNGGERLNNGLNFPKGAYWFISFYDESIGKQLIKGALKDPEMFNGICVREVNIKEEPRFTSKERLFTASPIVVRKYNDKGEAQYLLFNDSKSGKLISETLLSKMKKAGINYDISVCFDHEYHNPKTKLVDIKGIKHKGNVCPVILNGDPEAISFAWNVGLGHLTGSGFGALK